MPSQLLEQLLAELSTLASVYHKPPEAFLGQGRFGAEAMQRAAIEYVFYKLQRSFMLTCAHQGTTRECTGKSDCCRCRRSSGFWGPGPAAIKQSGLEGLAGTPQRVASPATGGGAPASTMDDLLGLFGDGGGGAGGAAASNDMMNGFASMDLSGNSQPPPPQQQLGGQGAAKSNQELLDLF